MSRLGEQPRGHTGLSAARGRDTHHGGVVIHRAGGIVVIAGGRAFRAGQREGRQGAHDKNLCGGGRRGGQWRGGGEYVKQRQTDKSRQGIHITAHMMTLSPQSPCHHSHEPAVPWIWWLVLAAALPSHMQEVGRGSLPCKPLLRDAAEGRQLMVTPCRGAALYSCSR